MTDTYNPLDKFQTFDLGYGWRAEWRHGENESLIIYNPFLGNAITLERDSIRRLRAMFTEIYRR